MVLHFIGLGLADERDITVKGLDIVKRAARVYLEAYTAILLVDVQVLEAYYGRPVIVADRDMVESHSDDILADAANVDIAFLVVGDPFGATTHTDLLLRARALHIPTETTHNASILNAIGCTGLQLYNFGQTVSMVFFTDSWRPASFYDRVRENTSLGLHTLLLLDIKVREPDLAALVRGKTVYEPPRFMTVAQCATQMLEVEAERGEGVYGPDSLCVGVARVGSAEHVVRAGTLREMSELELGPPLHSLVLVGRRGHELERDVLAGFAVDQATFEAAWTASCGDK